MRRMRHLCYLLLLGAVLGGVPESAVAKRRCAPCAFGGLCRTDDGPEPCGPSAARCVPRRGILVFNSDTPPTYVYWTFFGRRRPGPRGHLRGRLAVHVDAGVPTSAVPGFPGQCDAEVCFGQEAELAGLVVGDRLTATARWAAGATCDFDLALLFGFGDAEAPNRFVCRDAAGSVLFDGPLRLQGIRLFGCRTGP